MDLNNFNLFLEHMINMSKNDTEILLRLLKARQRFVFYQNNHLILAQKPFDFCFELEFDQLFPLINDQDEVESLTNDILLECELEFIVNYYQVLG